MVRRRVNGTVRALTDRETLMPDSPCSLGETGIPRSHRDRVAPADFVGPLLGGVARLAIHALGLATGLLPSAGCRTSARVTPVPPVGATTSRSWIPRAAVPGAAGFLGGGSGGPRNGNARWQRAPTERAQQRGNPRQNGGGSN